MTTGFDLANIKAEGTPVHPHEFLFDSDEAYEKQVVGYVSYWQERGRDMTRDRCYQEYLKIKGQTL